MEILLSKATRDELINELRKRESISTMTVFDGEGATIQTKYAQMAVEGESWIFVIKPNTKWFKKDTE